MTGQPAPLSETATVQDIIPAGLRVASTLSWLVGILTILVAIAVGIPTFGESTAAKVTVGITVAAGVVACVAGYLVRHRRKSGALLVILAWAFPTIMSLTAGGGARAGNVLLFVAMIVLLVNWRHLR